MGEVTPFRTALAAITAPPCEAGCRWRRQCGEELRACRTFRSYLRLAPGSRRKLEPPAEEPPSRRLYRECFSPVDHDHGRPQP